MLTRTFGSSFGPEDVDPHEAHRDRVAHAPRLEDSEKLQAVLFWVDANGLQGLFDGRDLGSILQGVGRCHDTDSDSFRQPPQANQGFCRFKGDVGSARGMCLLQWGLLCWLGLSSVGA